MTDVLKRVSDRRQTGLRLIFISLQGEEDSRWTRLCYEKGEDGQSQLKVTLECSQLGQNSCLNQASQHYRIQISLHGWHIGFFNVVIF